MSFNNYTAFLTNLCAELDNLTELQKKKIDAIDTHNLESIDECIKQEQAASLKMRGLEQQRIKVLNELGLVGVKMTDMAEKSPDEFKDEIKQLVELTVASHNNFLQHQSKVKQLIHRNLNIVETSLKSRGVMLNEDDFDLPRKNANNKTDVKI